MIKIIYLTLIIIFINTPLLAKSFNCFPKKYCPTLSLHFNSGKLLTECIGVNVEHPFGKYVAPIKIKIGNDNLSIYDLFGNPININKFERKNKLGNTEGFFNIKEGNFLGYLNNYEFNMSFRENFFQIQIRELMDEHFKVIYYVNGYCNVLN